MHHRVHCKQTFNKSMKYECGACDLQTWGSRKKPSHIAEAIAKIAGIAEVHHTRNTSRNPLNKKQAGHGSDMAQEGKTGSTARRACLCCF